MKQKNIILLSIDALRPDHLSCNGYEKIETKNIDEIAANGATFQKCITASCLTPVSMAATLTAKYPPHTGLRNPFQKITATTVTELLKNKGYATAGFTGINFLSERCNFHKGFDVWKEPTKGWFHKKYQDKGEEMTTNWGYWWPPEMMKFINDNSDKPFFVWGHYFEVHFHAEKWMLKKKMLKKGELSENAYYDAKVKYLDEKVIGPLNRLLKDKGLWKDTMIVLMSDHGETFMKNPSATLEDMEIDKEDYPKHRTMRQSDLLSTLIIKGGFKPGTINKDLVRTIDIVPTIMDYCFGETIWDADGFSLLKPRCNRCKYAYSEETYEKRGAGILQAAQDKRFKVMRNITTGENELYDLKEDLEEKYNLIKIENRKGKSDKIDKLLEVYKNITKKLDEFLEGDDKQSSLKPEDEKLVTERLKALGYI
jgi:arylsulfatase A-like enzyme